MISDILKKAKALCDAIDQMAEGDEYFIREYLDLQNAFEKDERENEYKSMYVYLDGNDPVQARRVVIAMSGDKDEQRGIEVTDYSTLDYKGKVQDVQLDVHSMKVDNLQINDYKPLSTRIKVNQDED